MHEVVPVKVLFHPGFKHGINVDAIETRVLDGLTFYEGMFECIARAQGISGIKLNVDSKSNILTPGFNPGAQEYFRRWARSSASLEPASQSLIVHDQTLKLFETNISPWVTNDRLPWIETDPYDPRRKILGISPEDVRLAIRKHDGIARPAELAGNDSVEVRVAFLCAAPATTHPEPLKIDLGPMQEGFFRGLGRPDLIYGKQTEVRPLRVVLGS